MQIVPITQVVPNTSNPRIIKDDKFKKLVKSIKEFPEMLNLRPIVVDKDMVVLGGNMRLKACQAAGLKEVPIIVADQLTPEQQAEFIIKDNVGFGEWDWDILANEWDAELLQEWGLDLPVDLDEPKVLEATEDEYEIPETITTSIVLGDLIEIGEHKLLCGSSTEVDTWEKLMGGELCDLVMTDPPYNINYQGSNGLTIQNDNMGNSDFYQFLYDFYVALGSYTKPGGAWYVWHASTETANFSNAMRDSGLLLKQYLVWVKNAIVLGRQDYQWKHELCLYGWKDGAAHQLNRKCYGMELDPKYCQVIVDRMHKLDPSLEIKINGKPYDK